MKLQIWALRNTNKLLKEIEVPKGADEVFVKFLQYSPFIDYSGETISLPKESKTKKWRWLLRDTGGNYCVTQEHKTETEANLIWGGGFLWKVVSRVEETEIEE